jgi:hypothetical protein
MVKESLGKPVIRYGMVHSRSVGAAELSRRLMGGTGLKLEFKYPSCLETQPLTDRPQVGREDLPPWASGPGALWVGGGLLEHNSHAKPASVAGAGGAKPRCSTLRIFLFLLYRFSVLAAAGDLVVQTREEDAQ